MLGSPGIRHSEFYFAYALRPCKQDFKEAKQHLSLAYSYGARLKLLIKLNDNIKGKNA